MALWKEPVKPHTNLSPDAFNTLATFDSPKADAPAPAATPAPVKPAAVEPAAARPRTATESILAPELVIEGKIEGAGHVRIAGRFKGDINVRGDLTIENGAKVNGSVRAEKVTVAGELIGNIESASHVELLSTGAITGDVKSRSFSVAKGSKMRGNAEFGWDDSKAAVTDIHKANSNNGN